MKLQWLTNLSSSTLLFCCITTALEAQNVPKDSGYTPNVGQAGKDVIWVPTPDALVQKMLEIAKVTSQDILVDLGSGDGRTVIAAAKLGAKAKGIEYNPEMVALSKKKAEEAGVSSKTEFLKADLFEYDLTNATVITMFLLPDINLKLRPTLLDLKPGTRIVSNTFTMGEWEPDAEVSIEENLSWNTALLWIVPAKVEGIWKLPHGELTIRQDYQMINGVYKEGDKTSAITEGRVEGNNIAFKVNGSTYTGQMTGEGSIMGTLSTKSSKSDWTASREK